MFHVLAVLLISKERKFLGRVRRIRISDGNMSATNEQPY